MNTLEGEKEVEDRIYRKVIVLPLVNFRTDAVQGGYANYSDVGFQ